MKLLLLIIVTTLFLSGCKKLEKNQCSSCKELKSGYVPPDYCGKKSDCDEYERVLFEQGNAVGQTWKCVRK